MLLSMLPSFFVRLFSQVRRAEQVPDLSDMLSTGLRYLNADEAQEVQQALAVATYAHSLNAHGPRCYEQLKVRCRLFAIVRHRMCDMPADWWRLCSWPEWKMSSNRRKVCSSCVC